MSQAQRRSSKPREGPEPSLPARPLPRQRMTPNNQIPCTVSSQNTSHHSLGREGEGPGEFRSWAALLVSPGDSLFVFDSGNRRLSVFSPDHELVRESRIGLIPGDGFFRADGSVFVSAIDRSPQRFGIPLHVLSAEGEVLQSFGEVSRPLVGRDRLMLGRRVSSTSPTVVWVSHIYQYILERRDQEGELIELLERHPEWFPSTEVPPFLPQSGRDPPPFPLVTDIQVDDSGLVWVLLWVASDDWKLAFGEGEQSPVRADLHDTIIEVIDPSERTVIGRARLDEVAIGFSAPGVFYTYNDRDVFDRISLWRVILSNDPA